MWTSGQEALRRPAQAGLHRHELLTRPSLLFLDEPTSGLDPQLDRDVMDLLASLAHGRVPVTAAARSSSSPTMRTTSTRGQGSHPCSGRQARLLRLTPRGAPLLPPAAQRDRRSGPPAAQHPEGHPARPSRRGRLRRCLRPHPQPHRGAASVHGGHGALDAARRGSRSGCGTGDAGEAAQAAVRAQAGLDPRAAPAADRGGRPVLPRLHAAAPHHHGTADQGD